jgi:hypothetical protein
MDQKVNVTNATFSDTYQKLEELNKKPAIDIFFENKAAQISA